jgi:hypothetical protein
VPDDQLELRRRACRTRLDAPIERTTGLVAGRQRQPGEPDAQPGRIERATVDDRNIGELSLVPFGR